MIHSSNVLGLGGFFDRSSAASIIPSMHLTCSSTGRIVMLFCEAWDGDKLWGRSRSRNTHLVRVRNPEALGANVRDTLVGVPILGLGERLVDHVVKVAATRSTSVQL